jgi:hypothetical protein
MKSAGKSIQDVNRELNLIPAEKLDELLKPANLLRTGYTVNDL